MAMQVGDQTAPQINVTPLIDVLLVLLIIFMVIVPLTPVGLEAKVPLKPDPDAPAIPDPTQLVVTINPDRSVDFNEERVEAAGVAQRFREIHFIRGDRPIFLRAASELPFAEVARVMDAARAAELTHIALMPPLEESFHSSANSENPR